MRTVAFVAGFRWTKVRVVILVALAIALVGVTLFNVVQELEYVRCRNEPLASGGVVACSKTSFTLPIVVIAVMLAGVAFLSKEKHEIAS